MQLLAQREHSRLELRRKLMRHAQAEMAAPANAAPWAGATAPLHTDPIATPGPSADWSHAGDVEEEFGRYLDADADVDAAGSREHAATSTARCRPGSTDVPSRRAIGGVLPDRQGPGVATSSAAGTCPAGAGEPDTGPVAAAAAELVDAALDWLQANGYLNEERFVESRVHARASRFGNQRIRQELAQHGVRLAPAEAQALKDSELARAHAVWARKFGHQPADVLEKGRQMRFLAGRGFSSEVVRRVVNGAEDD